LTTNEHRCILAAACSNAGNTKQCTKICEFYIGMHGASGTGGRMASANVPSDYALTTLRNSPAREAQPNEYKALDKYAATFQRTDEPVKSVYIYSPIAGNGKTTTACALLNEWITRQYVGALQAGEQPAQQSGYFLEINALQQLHKRMYSPGSNAKKDEAGDEFYKRMERAKKSPYLVVDDIGVRAASPSFMSEIYDLMNYRAVEVLPTCYTSNKSLEQLAELFMTEDPEGKVVSRISDRCVRLKFDGPTKRGLRK
jgi:DNA replication protein DnaC